MGESTKIASVYAYDVRWNTSIVLSNGINEVYAVAVDESANTISQPSEIKVLTLIPVLFPKEKNSHKKKTKLT